MTSHPQTQAPRPLLLLSCHGGLNTCNSLSGVTQFREQEGLVCCWSISHKIDILMMTETWLIAGNDVQVLSELISPEKHGGYVAVLFKEGLGAKLIHFCIHSLTTITLRCTPEKIKRNCVQHRQPRSRQNGFEKTKFLATGQLTSTGWLLWLGR